LRISRDREIAGQPPTGIVDTHIAGDKLLPWMR